MPRGEQPSISCGFEFSYAVTRLANCCFHRCSRRFDCAPSIRLSESQAHATPRLPEKWSKACEMGEETVHCYGFAIPLPLFPQCDARASCESDERDFVSFRGVAIHDAHVGCRSRAVCALAPNESGTVLPSQRGRG